MAKAPPKKKRPRKPRDRDIPLTLHPLKMDEALADLLQVKPPPKKPSR
jgi:hypothetical protein